MINSILPEMIGLEIRNKTRPSPCDDHSRSIRHIRSYLGQPFMESTPKSDICLEISVKHFTNKKSFLWIEGVISHTSFVRFASLVTQRHWPTYFRTAQDSRNTSHSFSLGGRQRNSLHFQSNPHQRQYYRELMYLPLTGTTFRLCFRNTAALTSERWPGY